jgi:hypothetical protein
MKTIWRDMKTIDEKIAFLRSGEAWASGAISIAMANSFADALERVKMLKEALDLTSSQCGDLHHPEKCYHKLGETCPSEEIVRKAKEIQL